MKPSQIEIIEQALKYLAVVGRNNYCQILSPNYTSSAGSHIRHIIDHYESIREGLISGFVDFNQRNRGSSLETEPQLATQRLQSISQWIGNLEQSDLDKKITLTTEISITEQKTISLESTIRRELIFVGSHAIHHYAVIAQICQIQDMSIDNLFLDKFGIAPATSTYLRSE